MMTTRTTRTTRTITTARTTATNALVAAVALALAGCASSAQVRRLEQRVAAMEDAEARRAQAVDQAVLDVKARLGELRLAIMRVTGSERDASELAERLAAVTERLEALEKRPVPSARPSRPAPDPAAVYAVAVTGAPTLGPDDALVTIVRAGEYACPYCEKVRPTLDAVRSVYGPDVRIVHLSFVVHPQVATEAAHAACAAHRQGRFFELDELLWEKAFKTRQFSREHLEDLAIEAGLDLGQFRADRDGPCPAALQAEMAMLARVGVGATPGFFINGRFLSGAQPLPAFQAIIDEELAKAKGRVKTKKQRRSYYDDWVMKPGLKALAPPPAPSP